MIMNINNFNKYYRFFGYEVFMKDTLYFNYMKMKKEYNKDYNFMPETFCFPKDKNFINKKFKNYTLNINNLWLIKPPNKGGGNGISIFDSLNNINQDEFLLTKYITHPHLINNKKYDLRLYVLITGLKPLRIYLNKEGLIRIAVNNFTLDYNSIKNKFVHLTNTDINIQSKNFIRPNNTENEQANTWNLHTYERYLKRLKIDYFKIKEKIKDLIIKSMISVYQNLTLELTQNNLNDHNFYDLLGYDIIITKNYNPFLLEINTGPAMHIFNKLDEPIKTNILVDTLNIVGISPYPKNKNLNRIIQPKINIDYNVNLAVCELSRPRGDFELIFPLKDNIDIYKKFFKKINNMENKLFWKIIKKSY